ncbi:MAG: TauD/TfdA family dioxygenase [Pseudomonadota bacterium]
MELTALHPKFGMEVSGTALRDATATHLYPEIREAFEHHSLLLFRGQHLTDEEQLALGRLFGPLEDRMNRPEPEIAAVSNETEDGGVTDEEATHTKNLKANQLWHTDSTFLPVPALANILQARVVPSEGGATEFVSTRAGFQDLTLEQQEKLRETVFHHRYAHSRAKIDPELAKGDLFTQWADQSWKALWPNPVTGEEAVYIASHVFAVEGMDAAAGQSLVEDLIAGMTRPEDVYSHLWEPGDVIIWDERATLHRGTSWPYDQPRTLVSICVSVQPEDGLDDMRMAS